MIGEAPGWSIHPSLLRAAAAVGAGVQALARRQLDDGVAADDMFRGLHIGPVEVERLLSRPPLGTPGTDEHGTQSLVQPDTLAADSPLGITSRVFALTPFEISVIVLCLLPEIDARYGELFGFLHDDVTRKQPTVGLALTLFAPYGADSLDYLAYFAPTAQLSLWTLVEATTSETPLVRQNLSLGRTVLWWLLGNPELAPSVAAHAHVQPRHHGEAGNLTPQQMAHVTAGLAARHITLLHGVDQATCLACALDVANALNRELLVVDGARLSETEGGATVFREALLEASLKDLLPCLTGVDALVTGEVGRVDAYRRFIAASPVPLLLISGEQQAHISFGGAAVVPVTIVPASTAERLDRWQRETQERGIDLDSRTLQALAEIQGLGARSIAEIVAFVRGEAEASGSPAGAEQVQRAARARQRLLAPALAVTEARYGWPDLILPEDRLQLLHHLCSRVRYRSQVRHEWKLGHGAMPGITALFAGPPGTGKSMAAEVIAHDLGLDVFRIDLSQVVSKYIGETEKNLARIFDDAERVGTVLLFDEADALFAKRSDVRDSHDRYANIETSYLLQRMERFHGLAILTTNLRANLDDAFTRRIAVSVDFPLPSAADRLRLWQRALASAPRDSSLSLRDLANGIELAGGAIVNTALTAAFLAAADQVTLRGDHVRKALRWELQKAGRLLGPDAFEALLPEAPETLATGS